MPAMVDAKPSMDTKPSIDAKPVVEAMVRSRRSGLIAATALGGLALVAGLAARALRGAETTEAGATEPPSTVGVDQDGESCPRS
jgi:hypothetical protein